MDSLQVILFEISRALVDAGITASLGKRDVCRARLQEISELIEKSLQILDTVPCEPPEPCLPQHPSPEPDKRD